MYPRNSGNRAENGVHLSSAARSFLFPYLKRSRRDMESLCSDTSCKSGAWQADSGPGRDTEFEGKPKMTCRIDRLLTAENRVLLSISGSITGQYVDLLRGLLKQERSVAAIDLKDVFQVDRDAVKLLALCESNGAELRNCAAYIREWITGEGRRRVEG